jgi:hypothetical protein
MLGKSFLVNFVKNYLFKRIDKILGNASQLFGFEGENGILLVEIGTEGRAEVRYLGHDPLGLVASGLVKVKA